MSECSWKGATPTILIYACSGAAIGAELSGFVESAKAAADGGH